jgi:hypothetical protein
MDEQIFIVVERGYTGKRHVRKRFEQSRDGQARFQTGKMTAWTEVNAPAETEMPAGSRTINDEFIRPLTAPLVAVSGAQPQPDRIVFFELHAMQLNLLAYAPGGGYAKAFIHQVHNQQ